MSAPTATPDLTPAEIARMLAQAGGLEALRDQVLKDQSYREYPIGRAAGKYLDGLLFDNYSGMTVDHREQTLAWLAIEHPTLEPGDVTYDHLRAFLEKNWKDAKPNTRAAHVSALRTFFAWLADHDLIPSDPARKLKAPRQKDTERRAHSHDLIRKLVVARTRSRDRCALLLMYWCALRRNELRLVQFRHIDLANRQLTVFGKGGTVLEQNIPEPVALELERHIQDRQASPDEYLLHPQRVGRYGTYPNYAARDVGGQDAAVQPRRHRQVVAADAVERAGSPQFPMHEIRHTAGTHFHMEGHDLVATQHFMRHQSAGTTERTYIHLDRTMEVARVQRLMRDPLAGDEDGE
jgi:integrase/recombinase XerC